MKSATLFCRTGLFLAICLTPLPGAEPPAPAVPVPKPAPELKLVERFDGNGDHRLDAAERQAARAYLAQHPPETAPGPSRPGQPAPLLPTALEPVKPGEKIAPQNVPTFTGRPLYAPGVVRTLFLEFADSDWEKELGDFARTDVLVPAQLTVDGTSLTGVGARFLSRDSTLGEGYKRSLELTPDHTQAGQTLAGFGRLTLLDAHADPTFLRSMLYYRVAREYVPTPAAAFVRTVINGESWGIYTSVQPFDGNFTREHFGTAGGGRFVATGGNLVYLGEDPAAYRDCYRLLSGEDPAVWTALIRLCRVLNQTPPDRLEAALAPLLDVEEALKFLALENALINQDGYGSAAGSYGLYLDPAGRFHLIPQLAEASFRLVEVREYDRSAGRDDGGRERGGRRNGAERETPAADRRGGNGDAAGAVPPGAKPKDFPRQSGSDLAMLLSYSFVNKADADFDRKLTKEEWLGFARSWFLVMDEDYTGQLTRDQFMVKVRLFVTPPSVIDGKTTQTFGHEDPAGTIGQDLFTAIDANRDGRLTMDEFQAAFASWFNAWSDPKSGRLMEDALRQGLHTVLTRTVFQADQSYIATRANTEARQSDGRGGGEGRGGRGGGESGAGSNGIVGLNLGPLNFGLGGGRSGRSGGGRSLVTYGEQLDPLAALGDDTKPLLAKLLAVPKLRALYLRHVRGIAENWLVWDWLGPITQEYHALIAADVEKDTHKPASYAHFVQELDQDAVEDARGSDETASLKAFAWGRLNYLREDSHSSR